MQYDHHQDDHQMDGVKWFPLLAPINKEIADVI
jgi:hypothetical protein